MKKLLALSLSLVLLLAAGCQSTPEEGIVKGKSSDALIEKAQTTPGQGTLAQRVNAPAHYDAAFSNESGTLTVTVDAAVTVPDAEAVPIIRVKPANITQAQTDVLMDQLVQGELYDFDMPRTKAEIADQIVEVKRQIAQGPSPEEANTRYSTEDGELTWEEYMQDVYLPMLQEQYDAAPETAERQLATGKLTDDGSGLKLAGGANTTAELGWESLVVYDSENMDIPTSAQYVRAAAEGFIFSYNTAEQFSQTMDYDGVDIEDLAPVSVTEAEARAMCDAVVKALDIPNMTLYAAAKKYGGGKEAPRCCWELQYTRNIGGVPVAYTGYSVGLPDLPAGASAAEAVYIAPWDYEKLNFYVNDGGIVGMNWQSPCQLTDTVTEDAALMDFADVADIFQKMFTVKYDGQDMDVTVSAIRLSYMRVSEQDKSYTGLLVPVWDFYGSQTWTLGDGEPYTFYDPDMSLLTINAVDGTVVDRSLGY